MASPLSWSFSKAFPSSAPFRIHHPSLITPLKLYSSLTSLPDKDPYKILGLDPTSTHTQLKGSFYQLTRVHHPDTPGGGDKEKFREVVDAWRFLSDPQRRRVYDERRSRFTAAGQTISRPSPVRHHRSGYRSATLSRRKTSAPDWMLHPDQGRKRPGKGGHAHTPYPRSSSSSRASSFRSFNHQEHYWHHYGQDRVEHMKRMRAHARERMDAAEKTGMGEHEQWLTFVYRVGPVTGMVGCIAVIFTLLGGGQGEGTGWCVH